MAEGIAKRVVNWIVNILLALLLIYAGTQAARTWSANQEVVGRTVNLPGISPHSLESYPIALVFWASWCGPCHMEINRIQSAFEAGKIPDDRIFLVSIDEDKSQADRWLADNKITLNAIWHPDGWRAVPIQSTPTIAFIDSEHRILDLSSGVSLFITSKIQSGLGL